MSPLFRRDYNHRPVRDCFTRALATIQVSNIAQLPRAGGARGGLLPLDVTSKIFYIRPILTDLNGIPIKRKKTL